MNIIVLFCLPQKAHPKTMYIVPPEAGSERSAIEPSCYGYFSFINPAVRIKFALLLMSYADTGNLI